mmetsp:Transcript_39164/g.82373  ORF Transcript_39164/g.82373 Transcript_39164/m.82373 type:complete len:250 (-) Transcript_39164:615-1364(-)
MRVVDFESVIPTSREEGGWSRIRGGGGGCAAVVAPGETGNVGGMGLDGLEWFHFSDIDFVCCRTAAPLSLSFFGGCCCCLCSNFFTTHILRRRYRPKCQTTIPITTRHNCFLAARTQSHAAHGIGMSSRIYRVQFQHSSRLVLLGIIVHVRHERLIHGSRGHQCLATIITNYGSAGKTLDGSRMRCHRRQFFQATPTTIIATLEGSYHTIGTSREQHSTTATATTTTNTIIHGGNPIRQTLALPLLLRR